jgi:hypothetical protein
MEDTRFYLLLVGINVSNMVKNLQNFRGAENGVCFGLGFGPCFGVCFGVGRFE